MSAARPKCPLSRPEVLGITKRLIEDGSYQMRRDIPLFYRVFAQYPDAAFWRAYQPTFHPDSMVYYLSAHGQDTIKTAISLFHLDIPTQEPYDLGAKTGDDRPVSRPKTTVASLFTKPK